jgi:hypothetical protein
MTNQEKEKVDEFVAKVVQHNARVHEALDAAVNKHAIINLTDLMISKEKLIQEREGF